MAAAWLDGDALAEIDTPVVVVDLDHVDANIERMAAFMRDRGVSLRPHAKTHKSLEIGRRQLAAGAVGMTVATIGEAEVFADGGFENLFIGYPVIASGPKANRLQRLADLTHLSIGADSLHGLERLASAFHGLAAKPRILIEIDCGGRRSGVKPEVAGKLALRAADLGFEVDGVFTHPGQSYADPARRSIAADEEVTGLSAAADALLAEGMEAVIISAGSTPTAMLSARPPVTEERPGTYVLGDRQQSFLAGEVTEPYASIALVVATTCVSHGTQGGFLVDAGAKTLTKDVASFLTGHGAVLGYPDAVIARVNDHHGIGEVPPGTSRPAIGEIVFIVPNHVCPVVDLVDELVVAQGGQVVDRWPVDARGRNS